MRVDTTSHTPRAHFSSTPVDTLSRLADEFSSLPMTVLMGDAVDEQASQQARYQALTFRHQDIFCDFTKQRLDERVVQALVELAEEKQLPQKISALFNGEAVNNTEQRAALHTLCRQTNQPDERIAAQWQKMATLVHKIHARQWRGSTGQIITNVVNIGVGGSDLGPLMAIKALNLHKHAQAPKVHFVSALDGRQIHKVLTDLHPETSLFVLASKSFTTIDTLSNAETARIWLEDHGLSVDAHFIGISANEAAMTEWGIHPSQQLLFWDWVGGRYSMWSSIGFVIALWLGMDGFMDLLQGAESMDEHFQTMPLNQNLPAMLGLIGIWNIHYLDIHAHAVLPYDQRLQYLPAYLEQLEMESNGKSVTQSGQAVDYATCPILWGEVGPNAQHAFYQLLHQGTESVMCDFILVKEGVGEGERAIYHQQLNIANCLAQSRALMLGQSSDDRHKHYPGNQPSTTVVLDQLSPRSLGSLIALYEHKVYTQAVIWDINPFDQWGVELGKTIAMSILDRLQEHSDQSFDLSTSGLIRELLK